MCALIGKGWQVEALNLVEVRKGNEKLAVVTTRRDGTQYGLGGRLHWLFSVVHQQDRIDL